MLVLKKTEDFRWLELFPAKLEAALRQTARELSATVFAAGGVVRDILLTRKVRDLDLVVSPDPIGFAASLAAGLKAPMFVLDEKEQVARIAWETEIDVTGFRASSVCIERDLQYRDFTINAMALAFSVQEDAAGLSKLIDPCHGLADLKAGVIRVVSPSSFLDDPLRLLRAYRFMATLNFSLEDETARLLAEQRSSIHRSAPERIMYEMDLLFSSPNSASILLQMQESGLLFELLPQLQRMEGVRQPLSHHLDVLDHSLATVQRLEEIFENPSQFFPGSPSIDAYFCDGRKKVLLKWAALLHDCGKPQSEGERNGRITFYNHDRRGAALFKEIADHYRWSRKDTSFVRTLIDGHMWPFHLNNVFRRQPISKRSCLRLAKRYKDDLPGLFLLAMADSLAGEGPEKPEGLEVSLAALYREVDLIYRQDLALKMADPPLLTGHDLIEHIGLEPGPIFKKILGRIRDMQLCGELGGKQQALDQARQLLAKMTEYERTPRKDNPL